MLEPSEEAYELLGELRMRIILLCRDGLTDKEIAAQLGCTESNVREHWKKIRKKLGANGRVPAVLKALQVAYQEDHARMAERLSEVEEKAARLEAENTRLRSDVERTTSFLNQAQRRAASRSENVRLHELFLQAVHAARAVAYDIGSLNPVSYRGFSPSASLFGIDVEETLNGRRTFFDIVHPDDVAELTRLSLGAEFPPDERYMYLFRVLMPEPRWILDVHQARYRPSGEFECVVGLAIDVHEMVREGAIEPKVQRFVAPEQMARHRPFAGDAQ